MCCCYCCVASVVSDSVQPHRRQPTRLHRPWDSPGKNTGGGCHFLLQCMKVRSESEVAQSCPTLCDPIDYSLPDSSVHGIFQARVLEWGAIVHFVTKIFLVISSGKRHRSRISETNSVQVFKVLDAFYLSLHFMEKETEGQRQKVTCPNANRFKTYVSCKWRL